MRSQRWRNFGVSLALFVALFAALAAVPTPFIAVGLGPTFDTLGVEDGVEVTRIADLPTFPTSGKLNMTTVGVTDGLNGLQVLQFWASGRYQVVPRSSFVRPGETSGEASARNKQLYTDSQDNAEAAALGYLKIASSLAIVVEEVIDGSPSVGHLQVGDLVLGLDGRQLQTVEDLHAVLAERAVGQSVVLHVQRADQPPADVTLTLGANPETGAAFLGVRPRVRPLHDRITYSLGDVGGPSAGLMFALGAVDKLTPGELTGGRFVAGTGTIDAAGTVGRIEGIPFKMRAAAEAGATVFLVPGGIDGNCDEARSTAPEGLQLVRVDDLAGAVAALDTLRSGGTPPGC